MMLSRTIEVTKTVGEDGASFEFYDTQSGDYISYSDDSATAENLGNELLSWADIMIDAIKEGDCV